MTQIFIPSAKIVIPTGTQTSEVNSKIEAQIVIVEVKISKYLT